MYELRASFGRAAFSYGAVTTKASEWMPSVGIPSRPSASPRPSRNGASAKCPRTSSLWLTRSQALVAMQFQFAMIGSRVLAIDNDMDRPRLLKHNAMVYGVARGMEFVHVDCTAMLENSAIRADVVLLSMGTPWGGPAYAKKEVSLRDLDGFDCHALLRTALAISKLIVFYMPRSTPTSEVAHLGQCYQSEVLQRIAGRGSTGRGSRSCQRGNMVEVAAAVSISMQAAPLVEQCFDLAGRTRAKAVYLSFTVNSLAASDTGAEGAAPQAGPSRPDLQCNSFKRASAR